MDNPFEISSDEEFYDEYSAEAETQALLARLAELDAQQERAFQRSRRPPVTRPTSPNPATRRRVVLPNPSRKNMESNDRLPDQGRSAFSFPNFTQREARPADPKQGKSLFGFKPPSQSRESFESKDRGGSPFSFPNFGKVESRATTNAKRQMPNPFAVKPTRLRRIASTKKSIESNKPLVVQGGSPLSFPNLAQRKERPTNPKQQRKSPFAIKPTRRSSNTDQSRNIVKSTNPLAVQGGSLKTWSFSSHTVNRVQVVLKTDGRPLDAHVEVWQGPDNIPHKLRVYLDNGAVRPFNCFIETPSSPNTIAIRNMAQLEFPLVAHVGADAVNNGSAGSLLDAKTNTLSSLFSSMMDTGSGTPRKISGGGLCTYPFHPAVESVQVLLTTDGRPLNARIELLQGPENNKQVMEVYTEDGMERPFFVIIETPGDGNVVRVVNSASVEFPLTATVEPFEASSATTNNRNSGAVIGGNSGSGFFSDFKLPFL